MLGFSCYVLKFMCAQDETTIQGAYRIRAFISCAQKHYRIRFSSIFLRFFSELGFPSHAYVTSILLGFFIELRTSISCIHASHPSCNAFPQIQGVHPSCTFFLRVRICIHLSFQGFPQNQDFHLMQHAFHPSCYGFPLKRASISCMPYIHFAMLYHGIRVFILLRLPIELGFPYH